MPGTASFVAALLLVGLVAGCGTASDEGTQPSPDVSTFGQGDFDDIPLLATSEPLTPPNEEEGNVARSYVVRNTTPEGVLAFYEGELTEFTVVSAPTSIGADTFRGRWELDQGRVLTVSATPAGNLENVDEFGDAIDLLTQYSLSLAPE